MTALRRFTFVLQADVFATSDEEAFQALDTSVEKLSFDLFSLGDVHVLSYSEGAEVRTN